MNELREFVYLDSVSVNNHLSSLGRGIPEEQIHQSEESSEKSAEGKAGWSPFSLGAGVSEAEGTNIETRLQISAPYQFESLLRALDQEGIDVHENPDVRKTQRSDVVKLTGEITPMALFQIELALKGFQNLFNEDTIDAVRRYSDPGENEEWQPERAEQFRDLATVVEHFTGDRIPLRMDVNGDQYAMSLKRDDLRVDAAQYFTEKREYTVVGRVEQRISKDSFWDPIEATDVVGSYISEEEAEEGRKQMKELGAALDVSDSNWVLDGRAAVIHPIAVYW